MKNQSMFRFFVLIGLLLLTILACNAGPLASLVATPTPTATNTPTMTPTSTPTNTPLPTATPTLIPTSLPTSLPTGTSKDEQPDGTVRFIDYDNKYDIVFPAGWTTVKLDPDDLNKMMLEASKSNPELKKTLTMLKNMDPEVLRVFVFDFQTAHAANGYVSNINIAVQNNAILEAMPIKTILDTTAQSIPQMYKGIKIISSKVATTNSNLSIGVIETNWSLTTATGSKVPVYQQMVIFKTPQGAATITLSTAISMQKIIVPEFKQIIDSLKMLSD